MATENTTEVLWRGKKSSMEQKEDWRTNDSSTVFKVEFGSDVDILVLKR